MVRKLYMRYCGDYFENVWNIMLVEYYCYLLVFVGQVL